MSTATELVNFIGTGWNLGNSLDAIGGGNSLSSETSWGNPKTTKAMIDAVKAQGFNTVRVPVSWGNHTTGDNFTIDSKWLARVKEVVDYCIDNDMYVILTIHHDTSTQYYYPSSTYKTQSVKFVKSIWTQVAKYFKDYDQHLVFETLNEPRLVGTGDEWWFPVNNPNSAVRDSISVINTLNQTAVDAIRAAGGKNTDRCIMVPGYGASIDGCTTPTFKLPDDSTPNRLIVSVHAYTPYNFALNANGTAEFTNDLKNEVDYLYSTIKSHFIDEGIPAIIGETSASNKNNAAERVKWAQYYMGKSAEYGVARSGCGKYLRGFYVALDIVFGSAGIFEVAAHDGKVFYFFCGEALAVEGRYLVWCGFKQARYVRQKPHGDVHDALVFGLGKNFSCQFYGVRKTAAGHFKWVFWRAVRIFFRENFCVESSVFRSLSIGDKSDRDGGQPVIFI